MVLKIQQQRAPSALQPAPESSGEAEGKWRTRHCGVGGVFLLENVSVGGLWLHKLKRESEALLAALCPCGSLEFCTISPLSVSNMFEISPRLIAYVAVTSVFFHVRRIPLIQTRCM